jgi:hypothetical protein
MLCGCDAELIAQQGAATGWTEPATNDITWGFALFFGGLTQLLAGQVASSSLHPFFMFCLTVESAARC